MKEKNIIEGVFYCPFCGHRLEYVVPSDKNSDKKCKNSFCGRMKVIK